VVNGIKSHLALSGEFLSYRAEFAGIKKLRQVRSNTTTRLQRAREEGNAPVSREMIALAVLGSAALVLNIAAPSLSLGLAKRLSIFLSEVHRLDPAAALRAAGTDVLYGAAPLVLAALVAAAAATMLQTGFLVHLHAAMPDPSRLNPKCGWKRIVSVTALTETLKSVVKLAAVAWAAWQALGAALPQLREAMAWDAATLGERVWHQIVGILLAMLAVQAIIATLDLLYVRFRHMRSLRMSRQDLREEHKELEGDPQIKARIKQIRFLRARKRMLAAVPKATVVITNPTHYAIALAYDRARGGAPRVVAKGVDSMAVRIRELAQDNGVPLVAEHYKSVAEIIAYVWRLRGMAAGTAP
jgi:flagellar biosynthetic protein FlhB